MYSAITDFIKTMYRHEGGILPLHEPRFVGNERKYVMDAIDSTFVSSVGRYVDDAERKLEEITGCRKAILCVNGTAALHVSLILAGVKPGSEVITQALTFVATANAISYTGAVCTFLDVDADTMGLSPLALRAYLEKNCRKENGKAINKTTGRQVSACLPMHTFGHACRIDQLKAVCDEWGIPLVEDAAEAIGSTQDGKHLGNWGKVSALSFNGNKIITSGGGGAVLTNDEELGKFAKHITTTAKKPHKWEYEHDHVAYNYRLPNLNAALLLAQLEQLPSFIEKKRNLASAYEKFFQSIPGITFMKEPAGCRSNYWLCAIKLASLKERNDFLEFSNAQGIMTRPIWRLMSDLAMYKDCAHDGLKVARELEETIVNVPSSVIL